MSYFSPSPSHHGFQFDKMVDQSVPSSEYRSWRSRSAICILDNYSLLNIFYLCRPVLLDEGEHNYFRILEGGDWVRERWWYDLSQVCQKWRSIILGSASYLGLCLVCTRGTPVADMLAHSPILPLVIDYLDNDDLTAEDEEGILLALQHHYRVRRIRLEIPPLHLQNFIAIMDDEFPILEFLFLASTRTPKMGFVLPKTFQAPYLRHLILSSFALPVGPPLFISTAGLVTLSLLYINSSNYFHPNDLFQRLSSMPQLETFMIAFHSPIPKRDIKRQLLQRPITTDVTLPNLRRFLFWGTCAYLETILPYITSPVLEELRITLLNQLTFSVPYFQQFLDATGSRNFVRHTIDFEEGGSVCMLIYPYKSEKEILSIDILCNRLDWQIASVAQILNSLTVASAAQYLNLRYNVNSRPPKRYDEANRTLWRDLLRPFVNVKTLHVDKCLATELSHALQPEDWASPTEFLAELKALQYFAPDEVDDAFAAFSAVRQNIGRPFSLVRL